MIDLGRRDGRLLRIGHRGAAALAPENSLEAIALAVELGCDLVEFDVHALDGALVVVHDRPQAAHDLPSLDDVLEFLRGTPADVHLDLKARGAEPAVAAALRRHGVVDRTVVSSFRAATLRALNGVEPALRLGKTYPQDRTGLTKNPIFHPPARVVVKALKRALPHRIGALLRSARDHRRRDHLPVEHRRRGAPVLVWTVDDPEVVPWLDRLGVDGVVTNDPRIFAG